MGKDIKFGGKQTMADKMAVASKNKSGKAPGTRPAPKADIKVKPMGGLKPHGVKITGEKKVWFGKR